jgi:hypothetical protein
MAHRNTQPHINTPFSFEAPITDFGTGAGVLRGTLTLRHTPLTTQVHSRTPSEWAIELQTHPKFIPRDRTYHFKTYKNVLVASEMLDTLVDEEMVPGRAEALGIMSLIVQAKLMEHTADKQKPFSDDFLFFVWSPKSIAVQAEQTHAHTHAHTHIHSRTYAHDSSEMQADITKQWKITLYEMFCVLAKIDMATHSLTSLEDDTAQSIRCVCWCVCVCE